MERFGIAILGFLFLFLAGCETAPTQGSGEETGKATPPYKVIVTPGGDPAFRVGELGLINTRLCVLLDRMTDSTEVWLAMYEFTYDAIFHRLMKNLREHPNARAHLLFDPVKFQSEFPGHRQPLIDSLRRFSREMGNLVLWNDSVPDAGLVNTNIPAEHRIMHLKCMLFTHPSPFEECGSSEILAVSSANMTYAEVGEANELVYIRDHFALNRGFKNYFRKLAGNAKDFEGSSVQEKDAKVWFFPFSEEFGFPFLEELDYLIADLDNRPILPEGIQLRVAVSIWDEYRKDILDRLLTLSRKYKVDMKFVFREDCDIAESIVRELQENLPAGSVRFLPSRSPDAHYGLHSKFMTLAYPTDTGTEYRVYTGSFNWNLPSLRSNSEILARIQKPYVYDAFQAHWNELWEASVDSTDVYKDCGWKPGGRVSE